MKQIMRKKFYGKTAKFLMNGSVTLEVTKLDSVKPAVSVTFVVDTKVQSTLERLQEFEKMLIGFNEAVSCNNKRIEESESLFLSNMKGAFSNHD